LKPYHKRFGYLLGLNGDQIAYATQASEGAVIVHESVEVKVDVLMENYNHTEERMHIALDGINLEKLEKLKTLSVTKSPFTSPMKLKVEFELKHRYFDSLHTAVEQLSSEVIARIMPQEQEFMASHLQVPDLHEYSDCSEDQLYALQAIAACPSNGPPILVAGAFGTGKTHILAAASHFIIFQGKSSKKSARVLVCTQQRASADTFLECCLKLMKPQVGEIYLIRDYGYKKPNLRRWYCTMSEFESYYTERSSYCNRSNFLIITTCLTALRFAKFLPRGFFTHILLDEGAQTREPEGVAPLSMAGRNTKIVIAGDQNQASFVLVIHPVSLIQLAVFLWLLRWAQPCWC